MSYQAMKRYGLISFQGIKEDGMPGRPVVITLCFHCSAQVQSLARELRSRSHTAQPKRNKEQLVTFADQSSILNSLQH